MGPIQNNINQLHIQNNQRQNEVEFLCQYQPSNLNSKIGFFRLPNGEYRAANFRVHNGQRRWQIIDRLFEENIFVQYPNSRTISLDRLNASSKRYIMETQLPNAIENDRIVNSHIGIELEAWPHKYYRNVNHYDEITIQL